METHLKPHSDAFPRACCLFVLGLTATLGLASIFAYLWHVGMLYVMGH